MVATVKGEPRSREQLWRALSDRNIGPCGLKFEYDFLPSENSVKFSSNVPPCVKLEKQTPCPVGNPSSLWRSLEDSVGWFPVESRCLNNTAPTLPWPGAFPGGPVMKTLSFQHRAQGMIGPETKIPHASEAKKINK